MAGASKRKAAVDDAVIDWLLVKHEESEDVTRATQGALDYLRHLKRGIPTPEVEAAACVSSVTSGSSVRKRA